MFKDVFSGTHALIGADPRQHVYTASGKNTWKIATLFILYAIVKMYTNL